MAPFASKAQARFMFAKHPKMAKEWASHTSSMKSLPEKKGGSMPRKHAKRKGY